MAWVRLAGGFAVLVMSAIIASHPANAAEITDQRGKAVSVPVPAQRAVIFPPVLWNYMTVDGGAKHIVGSDKFVKRVVELGLLRDIFPEALNLPDFSTNGTFQPNVEALLAAHPDVVFQWADRGEALYAPLERAGLPVLGLINHQTRQDQIDLIKLPGAVAGKSETSDRIIAGQARLLSELDREVGSPDAGHRPKVLWIESLTPLMVIGNDGLAAQSIVAAGGRNAAFDAKTLGHVNFEQILAWNPDVIIIDGWPDIPTMPRDLFSDGKWQSLAAVKTRHVYKIPLGGFRFGGIIEGPLMERWLAELLHPDRLRPTFRQMMKDVYRADFDTQLTDDQIDRTIYLGENAGSSNYGRFAAPKIHP